MTGHGETERSTLALEVTEVRRRSEEVVSVRLERRDRLDLPAYAPGSNLPVEWRAGRFNSYSLTGDGYEPLNYEVSVRLSPESSGGSRWIHDLSVGDRVQALRPRDDFTPVWSARKHLLLAAGIGVKPILSHARSHERWSRPFEVHYVTREEVHVDDLTAVPAPTSRCTGHATSSRPHWHPC